MRIALVGYGYWGKKILPYLKSNKNFEVASVYFRSLERMSAESRSSQYGAGFSSDGEAIWRDPSITGVIIATPIDTHYALAKKALLAGKHVFVEKPLCQTAQQCDELRRISQERGLKLVTDYIYTFSPSLLRMRELVRSGSMGKLLSIDISLHQFGRFLEFDVLDLLGSHAISIVSIFAALPEPSFRLMPILWNHGRLSYTGIQVQGTGWKGSISVNLYNPKREKTVGILLERGMLAFDGLANPSLQRHLFPVGRKTGEPLAELDTESYSFDERNGLAPALEYFFQTVANDRPDNSGMAREITAILETLRASHASNDLRYTTSI